MNIHDILHPDAPDAEIITALEEILARAKSGEIRGLVMTTLTADGGGGSLLCKGEYTSPKTHQTVLTLFGLVDQLRHEYFASLP